MTLAALIFPHQLYAEQPALVGATEAVLVEEPLLFTQYRFHRQKLILHRASLRYYAARLRAEGIRVRYIEAHTLGSTGALGPLLARGGFRAVQYVDPCDDWLGRRVARSCRQAGLQVRVLEDPHFLTPTQEIGSSLGERTPLYFTRFYIARRKRLGILLGQGGGPTGGKWSFDPENRKPLPKGLVPPALAFPPETAEVREAREYVRRHFPDAPGEDQPFVYPIRHADADNWLDQFVRERLPRFGDYEDAIAREQPILFHSVLTPMLNIGLLTPRQVVDAALRRADDIPLNSLEGFVRQVIGWREYIRAVYLTYGGRQRTQNFWGLSHDIPGAFYDASTGIEPVDCVIRRVLRTGYCHHIERLMVLGNFLLLCEVRPDAVYRWFMEMFVDAYDWVMVPNVYGMSQHADGGLITTKPYISGSAYVLKMSDFRRGAWCRIWDALYWRFVDRHADFFASNPRTAVIASLRSKLGGKLREHHRVAEEFLSRLHGSGGEAGPLAPGSTESQQ